MKAYTGTFTKVDGSKRTMNFVRLTDLPDSFLAAQIKGRNLSETRIRAKARMVAEGKETVWDLEKNTFRIFNWKTTTGEVTEIEIENKNFFENNT